MEQVKVWDAVVRGTHWLVAVFVLSNYALNEAGESLHQWLGYGASTLVVLRTVWGMVGSGYARFSEFCPTPGRLLPYLRALLQGREPRLLGHNPLAAVMMLTLMLLVLALGLTGFLMGTDAFWGDELMEEVHETLANVLISLVAVHVAAALFESWRHRENLVWSMVTGRKRREGPRAHPAG